MHPLIAKSGFDRIEPINVSLSVVPATGIFKLLSELKAKQMAFVPAEYDKMVLTYLSLGSPQDLYAELVTANPELSRDRFLDLLYPFLYKIQVSISEQSTMDVAKVFLLPEKYSASVALLCKPDGIFYAKRKETLMHLDAFLSRCGIKSRRVFVRKSLCLRFGTQHTYLPHIVLGHMLRQLLPSISRTIAPISLQPSQLTGISIKEFAF